MTEPVVNEGSITLYIKPLRQGCGQAALELWNRHRAMLQTIAEKRLRSAPPLPSDHEDIALGAFSTFCRAVVQGRFPALNGRDDVRRALIVLVKRQIADQIQHEGRQRRGGGKIVLDDAALRGDDSQVGGLDRTPDDGPTPEQEALRAEGLARLFDLLPDETLRVIALLKLEGYTNVEIAHSLDCAKRTVERKLDRIRMLWVEEVER